MQGIAADALMKIVLLQRTRRPTVATLRRTHAANHAAAAPAASVTAAAPVGPATLPVGPHGPLQPMWGFILLTPSDFKIVLAWRSRRDSGAGVIQKQRMPGVGSEAAGRAVAARARAVRTAGA
eukprot:scaffold229_cov57-Phaeocystis_antarctica.AAC.1